MMCRCGLLNDLGFNLYVVSSTSHIVVISEKGWEGLKRSYNDRSKSVSPLTLKMY